MGNFVDLTNMRFGNLTVVSKTDKLERINIVS